MKKTKAERMTEISKENKEKEWWRNDEGQEGKWREIISESSIRKSQVKESLKGRKTKKKILGKNDEGKEKYKAKPRRKTNI